MANRRWGRHPERTMCRITRKGLDYVFMELETEFLSTDVYRYYVDGLIIVYYTFDIQLLSNDIFDHVHLSNEDIKLLGEPEDMLYQRILKNTVSVFRTNLMPFHIYLNNIEVEEEELFRPIICRLIEVMEKIKYEKMLWCVTSDFGEWGASGGLYKPLLKLFCSTNGCRQLLLGFSNNDYALLSMVNESTIPAMKELTYETDSISMDSGKLTQKRLLLYDAKTNGFEIVDTDSKYM
jgi:hypothetical protein